MTPVAMPVLVVLLQYYPGAGTAVPAPRQGNPSVMSTFFTMEDCNRDRVSRGHSEDFFCLEYKTEKVIDYTFPADKQRQGSNDEPAKPVTGPQAPTDPSDDTQINGAQYKRIAGTWMPAADEPRLAREAPLEIAPPTDQAPKQKKVAHKQRGVATARAQQQLDPIGAVVAFFTPRDW